MSFIEKYSPYFPLFFNIFFPVAGILFFDWSVGDIYVLFFIELLFIGGTTIVKMLAAIHDGNLLFRLGKILGFVLAYCIIFIFIVVLTGNFFNGLEEQMQLTITITTVYMLIITYTFSFFSSYIFSGRYKRAKCEQIRGETFKYMGCIFIVLMVILIPFGSLMKNHVISYALGISIVMTRNLVDFFIVRGQERKQKAGT